ncbi:MAG: crossover junction endodeoxyribonuclease RuvC [Syntrophales bacterium]
MRILGVDPGNNITGYGLIEKRMSGCFHIGSGQIKLAGKQVFSDRLKTIYGSLHGIIEDSRPDVLALEDIFYGKNIKSLIRQGHVRGVIILAAAVVGMPVYEYTPLEIKKAVTGYGAAEKRQVQQMIKAILNLPELPPPDASDALAVAVCHSNFLKTVRL